MSLFLSGCASTYLTPGERADLQSFATDPAVKDGFAAKPSSPFPAALALVHVQSSGYTNYYTRENGGVYGSGRYSIVMTKEVGEESQLERVKKLPDITDIVSLNRMLIPPKLDDDQSVRAAAARLHADLLLVYTFDTTFRNIDAAKPLTVITLGVAPTKQIRAVCTASALLIDTRTGYVYSAYETTEKDNTIATSWDSQDTADRTRQNVEKAAFNKLVDEFARTWPQILARYKKGA